MNKALSILFVAYPLLPVSEESCGGAEQVLCAIERGLNARGHATTVAACAGSEAAGELLATCSEVRGADQFAEQNEKHVAATISAINERQLGPHPFDLVHDHSGHFWKHASEIEVPVLATLHLPRGFYPPADLAKLHDNVFFNCVSHSQASNFAGLPQMLGVVENGIDLAKFTLQKDKGDYLLWLGRICEEKAPHLAIEVARQCGIPLILAGAVYPFSYHQEYFEREVAPHPDGLSVRLITGPTLAEIIKLLQNARAVLIPSLVDETSSLVAMEAMACGTPVIALDRGALPEIIGHEAAGFVVHTPQEMSVAVRRASQIDPQACRTIAEKKFSAARMCADYENLFFEVIKKSRATASALNGA